MEAIFTKEKKKIENESTEEPSSLTLELRINTQIRDNLVSESLHLHYELERIKNETNNLERNISNIKTENRSLWSEMKTKYNEKTNKMTVVNSLEESNHHIKELELSIKDEERQNALIRNVLQRIIVASRVDWCENTELLDIMMHLDESPGINPKGLECNIMESIGEEEREEGEEEEMKENIKNNVVNVPPSSSVPSKKKKQRLM